MSQHAMFMGLLRPPVLYILRAAGFHAARPAALDSLVDIAARYLLLVTSRTSEMGLLVHNGGEPTVTDVRLALESVGALRPQVSDIEGQLNADDDMRGVESFVNWFSGEANTQIRRIAGLLASADMAAVEAGLEREDFLLALKKKHSKTGEESRFQGTMLGKDADERMVLIDGGIESIQEWEVQQHQTAGDFPEATSSVPLSTASSPLSDI